MYGNSLRKFIKDIHIGNLKGKFNGNFKRKFIKELNGLIKEKSIKIYKISPFFVVFLDFI